MSYTRYIAWMALAAALVAVLTAGGVYVKITGETRERRDQSCRGYEAQHAQEIRKLRRTYRSLEDPSRAAKALLKDPNVIAGVKDDVRAAQKDTDEFGVFVPPFCDEPGVGRPEPDPKVPRMPANPYLKSP